MPSARTTDCATETSRKGRAMMIASASMIRYCDTNQPASTFGEVVPLISPPTFSRNHFPADATALVKLRSALSPAAWARPPPMAPTPLVSCPRGSVAVWQPTRAGPPGRRSQSFCLSVAAGWPAGWLGPGAVWAMAAGAASSSRARTPTATRSRRPRARLGSWRIVVVLLESLGLLQEGVGRAGHARVRGERGGRVPGGDAELLPVAADPLEVDGGRGPDLLDGDPGDRADDPGGPHRDLGGLVVVAIDGPAERRGAQDHPAGDGPVGGQPESLADQRDGLVHGALQRGHRLGGGDRGDGAAAPGGVEQQVAGEGGGVHGGGGDGARPGVRVADPDA